MISSHVQMLYILYVAQISLTMLILSFKELGVTSLVQPGGADSASPLTHPIVHFNEKMYIQIISTKNKRDVSTQPNRWFCCGHLKLWATLVECVEGEWEKSRVLADLFRNKIWTLRKMGIQMTTKGYS